MNYIDLLTQEEKQSSVESSLVEISKNSLKETNRNSRKYEKDSGQIIDRAASAFDRYSQC